ncbi:MAG: NAD(P)H-binding protein [Anaerolineaceae bacterium]|nr:NAD(P)H-binding protein [Anaerolineaceae bacterium]
MKILLIGASGAIGSRILNEAVSRGHHVTAVSRHTENVPAGEHVTVVQADASDEKIMPELLIGQDALVSSISPRGGNTPESYLETIKAIIKAAKRSNVPYSLVVGGLSSLIAPDGKRILDHMKDVVPPGLVQEITIVAEARKLIEQSDINWTFFCPGGMIEPGERTGIFKIGGEQATFNFGDNTKISMEDFAVAAVDELENPNYSRELFHAYN